MEPNFFNQKAIKMYKVQPFSYFKSLKKSYITSVCAIFLLNTTGLKANEPEIITQSKSSQPIHVTLNQITLVKLKDKISDALVGNPAIADITIQTGQSFIITGKSYGRTNIILLNSKGETIFNKSITVDDQNENVVRIQRGMARVSYTCTPNCQPTPTLGDDPSHAKSLSENIKDKMKNINQAISSSADE